MWLIWSLNCKFSASERNQSMLGTTTINANGVEFCTKVLTLTSSDFVASFVHTNDVGAGGKARAFNGVSG